jgi:hypothetical protein
VSGRRAAALSGSSEIFSAYHSTLEISKVHIFHCEISPIVDVVAIDIDGLASSCVFVISKSCKREGVILPRLLTKVIYCVNNTLIACRYLLEYSAPDLLMYPSKSSDIGSDQMQGRYRVLIA